MRPAKILYRLISRFVPLRGAPAAFAHHNRQVWGSWAVSAPDAEVLVDLCGLPQTVLAYAYASNVLARRHNAVIKVFSSERSARWTNLFRIFESFNARGLVVPIDPTPGSTADLVDQWIRGAACKEDLLGLEHQGVQVGVAAYETFLRRFSVPTIDLTDPRLPKLLCELIGLLNHWEQYFQRHRVAAVIVSHDTYESDVICRVAYQHDVPVVLPNARNVTVAREPFSVSSQFRRYPDMFKNLSAERREDGIRWGQANLEERLAGGKGGALSYATASAFHNERYPGRLLHDTTKPKVLIATHCFYDNPHAYGGLLFPDFYEWISYLGKVSRLMDYEWYIKSHPDPLPGTMEIIHDLTHRFDNLVVLPISASAHQMVSEGLSAVLTCYGSVGEEYPLLGVPVITAGYNPRWMYGFNEHPRDTAEYEALLHSVPSLVVRDHERMPEFYFMHHRHTSVDDFMLPSYQSFTARHGSSAGVTPAAYAEFVAAFKDDVHEQRLEMLDDYLQSPITNLFEFVQIRRAAAAPGM